MIQETKSVSRVVLRDNILDQIKHAELYKTFREMLTPKYNAQEQAFFKETWIAFSLNGKKGYWNKEVQVAVPVQCIYAVLEEKYFDIECAEITEETIVSLFDSESECPDEIMQGIKASQAFQNGHWIGFTGGSLRPTTDNNRALGNADNRWSVLYAATGAINTSDERDKLNIRKPSDAVLDAWDGVEWKIYQLKDSVDEKGDKNARIHAGIVAQDVSDSFSAQGIDACRFGLFCHDEWEDGDRYGIRYAEALALEAACQRRRAEKLEARIAALEEAVHGND